MAVRPDFLMQKRLILNLYCWSSVRLSVVNLNKHL